MDLIMINKEQLMAFTKIEKLKNCPMKWGLIYLMQTGYVTNLKYLLLDLLKPAGFWNWEEQLRLELGKYI